MTAMIETRSGEAPVEQAAGLWFPAARRKLLLAERAVQRRGGGRVARKWLITHYDAGGVRRAAGRDGPAARSTQCAAGPRAE